MKKSSIIAVCIALAVILLAGGGVLGYSIAENSRVNIDYQAVLQGISCGNGPVYVIGHKNPDTDTVCSAIAYANLLKNLGINAEARTTGPVNEETRFVLDYFGVNAPPVLENAAGKSIIAVDHNSYTQAVDGMDAADILGIIDHHNTSGISTASPVYYLGMPVGATATIVWISYLESGIEISKQDAGLLASAILSDTADLRSSTTTALDAQALGYLADIAGISDIDDYYQKMLNAAISYTGMSDDEIFHSDYKEYDMSGNKVGIAVVNAAGREKADEMSKRMTECMKQIPADKRLDNIYVIIIDRENNTSKLIFYGAGAEEIAKAAFGMDDKGDVSFPNIPSRKKDIVPALTEMYKQKGSSNMIHENMIHE